MFWVSRLCDAAAVNIRQISMGLLIYRLTNSPIILGGLILARAVSLMALALYAGAIADRSQKKYIIQIAGAVDVFIVLVVFFSLISGYLSVENAGSWWVLIAVSFIDGLATTFKGPAADAIVVEVVGERLITNAVALTQVGQNTLRLAAPVIAGAIIDHYGFEVAFEVMAGIYIVAVVFLIFIPPSSKPVPSDRPIMNDIKEAWGYITKEKHIFLVLIVVLAITLLSMPYRQLMPIFTEDILKVDATMLGILQGVSAGGAIIGGIVIASLPSNRKRGTLMLLSGLALGISLVFFSFSTSLSLSLAMMVIVGLGQAGRMTLSVALLQYYTRSDYRARVMSFYGIEIGLSSLGTFFAAALAEGIGVEWAVGSLAFILIAGIVLSFFLMPQLRKLD
ncbi:MAG TPA: MFS transporter [Dehalococcoidia bacterium]|nr:MFS transporter [Dehalococcoidia bacterium]